MELAIGATLYLTFGAWLTLPTLGAPEVFTRMSIGLCGSEFVAAVIYGFTRADFWASLAGLQLPVIAGIVGVLSLVHGVFVVRGW
jgi:hypothetical protein